MAQANHIKRTWQGQVTWAAGEQTQVRALVAGSSPNTLATLTSNPTSWSQFMQLDLSGYLWAGMHIYGKKIVHAESMTFSSRYVHSAMGIADMPALAPQFADGHYEPWAWLHGGALTKGNLNFIAARGGIHDSMTLNTESSADVTFHTGDATTQVNNINMGRVAPYDRLAVCPRFTAGATVLTGTNTWLVQVTLYACR